MAHITKIVPNNHCGGHSDFILKVVCSCQFEALAKSAEAAAYYEANHLARHGMVKAAK